jgi:3-hydroxyisobutyrate dehydrogenase-like beta-hydroxyacid dehydrogenase
MGVPLAGRLLAAGHQTTMWIRTEDSCSAAGEQGARVAATIVDAVRGAEIVIPAGSSSGCARFGTDPVPVQFGLGLAEKDLALALAAGADPAGFVDAAQTNVVDGRGVGPVRTRHSAVVADKGSRARTTAIKETRGL